MPRPATYCTPLMLADPRGELIPAADRRAAAVAAMFALTLKLGGTVAGEHSVGVVKRA